MEYEEKLDIDGPCFTPTGAEDGNTTRRERA